MLTPVNAGESRTLTVFCAHGLGNRLRVLLSGLALAEASSRTFKMLWPLTPACAGPFADLFAGDWPVTTVPADAVAALPYITGWFGMLPDVLTAQEAQLVIGHPTWLLRPEQYPGHAALLARCQVLFADLRPAPPVQQAIDAFHQRHFRPTMIGVHLRRGDLLRERPDTANNTAQALAAVDGFLARAPDAGILLCTDDGAPDPRTGRPTRKESVLAQFVARYGGRVVSPTPRSLNRASAVALQDAAAELYLLRTCHFFVGTAASSFSGMVTFGRDTPHVLAAGATPTYQWIERVANRSGLSRLLNKQAQERAGQSPPFVTLLRHYGRAPLRRLRRLLTR